MVIKRFFNLDAGAEGGGAEGGGGEAKVDFTSFVPVNTGADAGKDEGSAEIVDTDKTGKKPDEKPATPEGGDNGSGNPEDKKGKPAAAPEGKNWYDAIKDVDKTEVLAKIGTKSELLKALGVNDFIINLHEHYENGGDPSEYMRVNSVDYSKMADEDAILAGIRAEKPGAPEAVIQKLYKNEMEKYKTDPEVDDQESIEYADWMKKEKANEYRAKLIEEQKKYAIPAKKEADAKPAVDQAKIDEINRTISESEVSKKLISDKKIFIGGKDGYGYEVKNPQEFIDIATGKENFFALFTKQDGEIDLDLFYATVAFAKDRANYDKSAIGHGKTLANKDEIDDRNPDERISEGGAKPELSDWQKLEKSGRVVNR